MPPSATAVTTTPLPSPPEALLAGASVRPSFGTSLSGTSRWFCGVASACFSFGKVPSVSVTAFSWPSWISPSLTEAPGAMVPMRRASSRASWISVPSTEVMTSPLWMPALTVGLSLRHQRAGGLLQAHAVGEIGCQRLDLHADPSAGHAALVAQLRDHGFHGVCRNGKGDADGTAGWREDRRVDADDVAVDVKSRAAGIALVHRGVDLNEVVIGTGADIAAARRD